MQFPMLLFFSYCIIIQLILLVHSRSSKLSFDNLIAPNNGGSDDGVNIGGWTTGGGYSISTGSITFATDSVGWVSPLNTMKSSYICLFEPLTGNTILAIESFIDDLDDRKWYELSFQIVANPIPYIYNVMPSTFEVFVSDKLIYSKLPISLYWERITLVVPITKSSISLKFQVLSHNSTDFTSIAIGDINFQEHSNFNISCEKSKSDNIQLAISLNRQLQSITTDAILLSKLSFKSRITIDQVSKSC